MLSVIVKRQPQIEMNAGIFFQKVRTYHNISEQAEEAWTNLLREKVYHKGDYFVRAGQVPKKAAFVCKGLFSQYYITDKGDTVIKYFFPEGRIAGSMPATLTKSASLFTIEAIENTSVLEYDFHEFKKLVSTYKDIAEFYIRYMEQHWIVDKEPYEISLRNDSARIRYDEFLSKYPRACKTPEKTSHCRFSGHYTYATEQNIFCQQVNFFHFLNKCKRFAAIAISSLCHSITFKILNNGNKSIYQFTGEEP